MEFLVALHLPFYFAHKFIEALSPHELVIPFENYGGVWPVGTLVPWAKITGLAFIGAVI
ncbi:MAG: hypothetical protein Q8Q41_01755 [bacterium]|nr:hypothetical protein [bacterium]